MKIGWTKLNIIAGVSLGIDMARGLGDGGQDSLSKKLQGLSTAYELVHGHKEDPGEETQAAVPVCFPISVPGLWLLGHAG